MRERHDKFFRENGGIRYETPDRSGFATSWDEFRQDLNLLLYATDEQDDLCNRLKAELMVSTVIMVPTTHPKQMTEDRIRLFLRLQQL
jgi:hypothetical protein